MDGFEITIHTSSSDRWPVVAEEWRADGSLPVVTEGTLHFDSDIGPRLLAATLDPVFYGRILGEVLFTGDIGRAFERARARSTDRLHVFLRVEASDLKPFRWERLAVPGDVGWELLALNQHTPYSQYLPSRSDRRFPPFARAGLRALVVAASPRDLRGGLSPFNVEAAVSAAMNGLGPIPSEVLATDTHNAPANLPNWVGPATLDALCDRITTGRFTLLHLICHGAVQNDNSEYALVLAKADGTTDPVSSTRLLQRLSRLQGTGGLPHLTFLSACESASEGEEAAFGGLAQRLVRELGMPAAVAMTDRVTVPTATALASAFYARLREHGEPDRALVEAGAGLAERGDIVVPALFSRLGGRPLFGVTDRPPTDEEVAAGLERLDNLLRERAPILLPEFNQQATTVLRTLGIDPDGLVPKTRMERAQAMATIEGLCQEAVEVGFAALAFGQPVPMYDARAPFPGMHPFDKASHEFFFGRDALTAELKRALDDYPFLAVLGPSGSGKSSLVLAGLLPMLEEAEPHLSLQVLRPGSDPLAQLSIALSAVGTGPGVIVVDQFEEIFTVCPDEVTRRSFFDRLLALLPGLRVVITMGVDFLNECSVYHQLAAEIAAHQRLVGPMTIDELGIAMSRQAASVGLRFEADLGTTILEDVEREPGAMPLLQHALRELWERRHGRLLPAEEYRAVGGVSGGIARTAERLYQDLPEDQGRIQGIFVRLTRIDRSSVTEGERRDTRRRVALRELMPAGEDAAAIKALVKQLADARLVVTGLNQVTGEDEVEVAHEALIRHWSRLRNWLAQDWQDLRLLESVREDAAEWEAGQRDDALLRHRGAPLLEARTLVSHRRLGLTLGERNYLDRCAEREARELMQQRRDEQHRRANLAETGWAVIFPQAGDPAVREALSELLAHRRREATRLNRHFYQELVYRPGETAGDFLKRHRATFGPVDPEKVPYYLLLVGDPEAIPFTVQYQLGIHYGVGRLHFDSLDQYASYARSVVHMESIDRWLPRRAVFFGPHHADDRATERTTSDLVHPLAEYLGEDQPSWEIDTVTAADAQKTRLRELLGGPDTPALLFFAGHGMEFSYGDERQLHDSGALLCSDWSRAIQGPPARPTPDHYFAASELDDHARLLGLVAFFSAPSTAGTSRFSYVDWIDKSRRTQAPHAFVARLPQGLLGHPQGGALAVIGHVDTWFLSSFLLGRERQLTTFRQSLIRMLEGYPIGPAMEDFGARHASMAAALLSLSLEDAQVDGASVKASVKQKHRQLETINDRNWVIFGDPAVRLMVTEGKMKLPERPTIESVTAVHAFQSVQVAKSSLRETAAAPPEDVIIAPSQGQPSAAITMLVFNGVDATTGEYALPPMTAQQLSKVIQGEKHNQSAFSDLGRKQQLGREALF